MRLLYVILVLGVLLGASARASCQISFDDLKSAYIEKLELLISNDRPIEMELEYQFSPLPGRKKLLQWEDKVYQTWLERRWIKSKDEPELPVGEVERIKSLQAICRGQLQSLGVIDRRIRLVFRQPSFQVAWREKNAAVVLPGERPLEENWERYADVSFVSSFEKRNQVIVWSGDAGFRRSVTIIPVTGLPHRKVFLSPPIGAVQNILPFKNYDPINEFYTADYKKIDVELTADNKLLVTGVVKSKRKGLVEAVYAEVDPATWWPNEIHFFILLPNEMHRLKDPENAYRSVSVQPGKDPVFGYFPQAITQVRRNGAIRLYKASAGEASTVRDDGMEGLFEIERQTIKLRSLKFVQVSDQFFKFKIPETITISNEITGDVFLSSKVDELVDSLEPGADDGDRVRSGFYRDVALWPNEIHFFILLPNEMHRLKDPENAYRSVSVQPGKDPVFGYFPQAITQVRRNGAIRLYKASAGEASTVRDDGMEGLFEIERQTIKLRSLKFVQVSDQFFKFKIPETITISNEITGDVFLSSKVDELVDSLEPGADDGDRVRSGFYRDVALWLVAALVVVFVIYRFRVKS